MSIVREDFGILNGQNVYVFKMDNGKNLSAEILNLGGIIKSLVFKGTDVALGRETLEHYLDNYGRLGALIGRNANRISKGEFVLNDKKYTLFLNLPHANLHGGKIGFDQKVWDAKAIDGEEPQLVLTLKSPDGEEGFPGNVDVKVTYTLTKEDSIKINYYATTDEDTVFNMTNHSYFNLNGHDSGEVSDHTLTLDCDFFTPAFEGGIPTGEILSVNGTPYDFRSGKKVKEGFDTEFEQYKTFGCIDHNFVKNGRGFTKCATAVGDKTGIVMETYTDLPGVHIYTPAKLDTTGEKTKGGATYEKNPAICFETQYFPNGINIPHFPSPILKKGEVYDKTTEFKFK